MNLQALIRKNIWELEPYSCARNEFQGDAAIFLDANENPLNAPYNRYPDPLQRKLKQEVSKIKGIDASQIFFGVGSDEPIDLTIRIFCEPDVDNIVAMDPTYGMYQVCANINNVEYRKVSLNDDYTLNAPRILDAIDEHTKLIFLCSPNNPTGNQLNTDDILKIIHNFQGIVVVDEAYIDFASGPSLLSHINEFPNLILFHTFSKAWGLAAVRLGMAFASKEIISVFNKVKYPYNINQLTQLFVENEIRKVEQKNASVKMILAQREIVKQALLKFPFVYEIHHSDANFLLVRVNDANRLYQFLVEKGIVTRNRTKLSLCLNHLRITIGKPEENEKLLSALAEYK